MNFDNETIGTGGDACSGDGRDECGVTRGMTRVDDDRKVRKFFEDGHGVDVGGVAGGGFKGADAALAQDDAMIAAVEDVFACHQHFFDGGRHAAFEEHRRAGIAEGTQQVEVLHVARAELEYVYIFFHHRNLRDRHHFNDQRQTGFLTGFCHVFETFFAKTLKGIR